MNHSNPIIEKSLSSNLSVLTVHRLLFHSADEEMERVYVLINCCRKQNWVSEPGYLTPNPASFPELSPWEGSFSHHPGQNLSSCWLTPAWSRLSTSCHLPSIYAQRAPTTGQATWKGTEEEVKTPPLTLKTCLADGTGNECPSVEMRPVASSLKLRRGQGSACDLTRVPHSRMVPRPVQDPSPTWVTCAPWRQHLSAAASPQGLTLNMKVSFARTPSQFLSELTMFIYFFIFVNPRKGLYIYPHDGWEVQKGGDICIPLADSCWGLTGNNKIL